MTRCESGHKRRNPSAAPPKRCAPQPACGTACDLTRDLYVRAVRGLKRQPRVVLDQQDADAGLGDLHDALEDLRDQLGRKAKARLVRKGKSKCQSPKAMVNPGARAGAPGLKVGASEAAIDWSG